MFLFGEKNFVIYFSFTPLLVRLFSEIKEIFILFCILIGLISDLAFFGFQFSFLSLFNLNILLILVLFYFFKTRL